ncbi:MAG: hypothetical protein HZA32_01590 [Opitutae bacterium]|nr:hypothetical protein [Opitutae bacterium]
MPRPAVTDRLFAPRTSHPHAWLWEPLENEPGFVLRTMFGAKAVYLDGKIVLCFSTGDEPWRGLLLPTHREHHAALRAEFPDLVVHSVLGKWLYLPEAAASFERTAQTLVALVRRRDPRLGVVPPPKKRRAAKADRATRPRQPRRRAQ